ncbi:helix-turn-helix domain-containing protein [Lichenicola cladoniae]|uniref:Helix-turn-helix domain-containing protein n=1 Tax=Lichenicola cladoniae TaxID=1484109 RepID=A0A6M8HUS6_9PROT|nr:helix-turn-helix domain-containing protein [Acetobacteraceae bacterium]QKE91907.1 helix-turn-helix domain-containing protein [Lichenicola cladoniae]
MTGPYAYSVSQLAKAWGVSDRTVYTLVASGQIGHLRIGKTIRVRQADRDAYEAAAWNAPAVPPPAPPAVTHAFSVSAPTGRVSPNSAFRKGQKSARAR